jgi:mono/diheme cytochrome c family protein
MSQRVKAMRRRLASAVLVGCCAASIGCDFPWRYDMHNQPSPSAATGPRSPASGSFALEADRPFTRQDGESVTNPLPVEESVQAGEALYRTYCLPCHGGAVGQYFPRMPSLTSADVQRHGDGWWYATITNGTGLMPSSRYELTPHERWQIVHFVRQMTR